MDAQNRAALSAAEAARMIRDGVLTSEELVQACLDRCRVVEPDIQAWAFLDEEFALEQARAADEWKRNGNPIGPLHGVPVGLKDIIDTADYPTEYGTVLYKGHTPRRDATVVSMLRAAGAVIMGKTVTTELATYAPGKTRNPHNLEHTPGGSSSGSAAAVAAGMVPLAVGTQTNGSVIRPAAFCGVFGFKPTFGLIPRHGILKQSRTLDQVGVFARTIEDVALITEQIVGYDERDPDTHPRSRIPLCEVAAEEPPIPPKLGFVKWPMWDRASDETKEAFGELIEHLGDRVEEIDEFPSAREALEWHRTIMEAEMAANFVYEWEKGRKRLSGSLREQLKRGRRVSAYDYQRALARIPLFIEGFAELFYTRYDAIITPSAPGTAPRGLDSTGDPSFCTIWTLCGMPALNLPLMRGMNGLPLGVQLVGARYADARLLRTARWLVGQMAER
jgi:Asp-tRNA(Asn)/Glu-tRNA(Gln) amidotransferase A subunit family amidase